MSHILEVFPNASNFSYIHAPIFAEGEGRYVIMYNRQLYHGIYMSTRHILVTTALPYANGPLHLGHMVGYIQADIWVRFMRMQGHECWHVCGSDAHGTPIMLYAQKQNISPEELVAQVQKSQLQDFTEFAVNFDNFSNTNTETNRELVYSTYKTLAENNHISRRTISQLYDPVANMFLPDRYVKGECPRCGAPDQYGDACEVCGATYSPEELRHPVSVVTGATPVTRESEHLFFRLPQFTELLKKWMQDSQLQEQVKHKLDEWFQVGLQEWDISRDAPYFGFEIPDAPGKYFYVWVDAPIGYMASFKELCEKKPELNFVDYWGPNSPYELYHFLGKDIIYFHALFWPAMLAGSYHRLPNGVWASGFLTVNGQKMSKSRGTFIRARTYLDHCGAEYLRYYYATKLSNRIEDVDLNLDDFISRVNSDLVGKLVNIASRCANFITQYFDSTLAAELFDHPQYSNVVEAADSIARCYEQREFSRAMRDIMQLADQTNQFIDLHKPWVLIKNPATQADAHRVCTQGINIFRLLMLYLKPVLPQTTITAEEFLQVPEMRWADRHQPLLNHRIKEYSALLSRIDPKQVEAMLNESKEDLTTQTTVAANVQQDNPILPTISIDDFAKVDLRIAKILNAESVPDADKLLKLTIDLGGETRTIFAGIKAAYQPEELIGKLTLVVANLAPRKMRFGVSEGMVAVAVHPEGKGLWILEPQAGAEPGMRVK